MALLCHPLLAVNRALVGRIDTDVSNIGGNIGFNRGHMVIAPHAVECYHLIVGQTITKGPLPRHTFGLSIH